jgi:hypothetical protein
MPQIEGQGVEMGNQVQRRWGMAKWEPCPVSGKSLMVTGEAKVPSLLYTSRRDLKFVTRTM